jgi:stage V sporulation protein R
MGLAYEIVINSNPCIAYLMEENTMTMQALVIAHAAYGHNSFFKGNYLFRTWTDAEAIIDYLVFARNYISECEERHGEEAVELLLDSCHALMNYGVDRYKRPANLSMTKEQARQREREDYLQAQVNDLWRTLPAQSIKTQAAEAGKRVFPPSPRRTCSISSRRTRRCWSPGSAKIVRIVRKIGQYFYPQRQTQVMNEGWATFWHYTLLNPCTTKAGDRRLHAGIPAIPHQRGLSSRLRRAHGIAASTPMRWALPCGRTSSASASTPPTKTARWFPDIAGSDWRETFDFAMRNFKDESFIAQFLSPKLIRDFKLFAILDDDQPTTSWKVAAIHDDAGHTLGPLLNGSGGCGGSLASPPS